MAERNLEVTTAEEIARLLVMEGNNSHSMEMNKSGGMWIQVTTSSFICKTFGLDPCI